jgi:hypothetical protein
MHVSKALVGLVLVPAWLGACSKTTPSTPVAATGGAPTTGNTSSGGAAANGGTTTGGTKASGGSPATGGAKAPGGSPATGGAKASGGSPATGGAAAMGGATATGGTTALACPGPAQGEVTLSVPSGTFQGSLSVTLSTTKPGAEIRYTTDGKAPTSDATLYTDAGLAITRTTRLRAQAFVGGVATGTPTSALYIARDVVASSELPILVLDSYGSGKLPTAETARAYVDVGFLAFEPADGGTASLDAKPTTASFAAFHVRGNSSAMFDKVPYRLELRNEAGDDRDCPLLGMPAEADWALVGPHADKTLIHNNFVYELGRDLGMAVPRVKLAEVYVNLENEPLEAEHYQGVYQVVETIKNQKNRLNLKQLKETKISEAEISGGYIFSFEWMITPENPLPCPEGTANPWNYLELVDPEPAAAPQRDYLTKYLVDFNAALHGSNPADPATGYPRYIDPKTWVDQIIVNEFTRNMDAYVRSQYFYKDRDAKANAGPLWDFDLIAGVGLKPGSFGATMANTTTDGWQYEGNASRMTKATGTGGADAGAPRPGTPTTAAAGTADWFLILLQDPAFKAQLVARWKELRGGLLSDSAVAARIDGLTKGLGPAADRNFKKWNILTQARVAPFDTPTEASWTAQIAFMKDWLQKRAAWLDGQWK